MQELQRKLSERLHFDELEKSPNVVLSAEIVVLLCLNSFVMWWAYEWMQGIQKKSIFPPRSIFQEPYVFALLLLTATNLVIFQDFDSTIIVIGICLGVDAIVIGTVKRNTCKKIMTFHSISTFKTFY